MVCLAYGEMIVYKDEVFGFFEIFNEDNGTLYRSDANGINPIMRSFPELIDVGIMGHCDNSDYCRKAGIDCYQKGSVVSVPHMSHDMFLKIVKQATGKTFQIALGGAGDPNKHPQFEEILKSCRKYRIVPNMTTSGFLMKDTEIELIKKYCGAVAVSWYSRLIEGTESNQHTINAIERLIKYGCTTNVHFVVSKDTIDEAIIRLEKNLFPRGINAVVFLLYKPVGDGVPEKVLLNTDNRIRKFLYLATNKNHPYKIGFDTCFTPAILKWAHTVPNACVDACEAATFSMYIDSQMNCYPCSFDIWNETCTESLNDKTLQEIWLGKKFNTFRNWKKDKCINCHQRVFCQGGCKILENIDLC